MMTSHSPRRTGRVTLIVLVGVMLLAVVFTCSGLVWLVNANRCETETGFRHFSPKQTQSDPSYIARVESRRCSALEGFDTRVVLRENDGQTRRWPWDDDDGDVIMRGNVNPVDIEIGWRDSRTLVVSMGAENERWVTQQETSWNGVLILRETRIEQE